MLQSAGVPVSSVRLTSTQSGLQVANVTGRAFIVKSQSSELIIPLVVFTRILKSDIPTIYFPLEMLES